MYFEADDESRRAPSGGRSLPELAHGTRVYPKVDLVYTLSEQSVRDLQRFSELQMDDPELLSILPRD